jgi:hypothetical protein
MQFQASSRVAFTLLIAAFVLHNSEEAYTICRYHVIDPFPAFQQLDCRQFLVAVFLLSAVAIVAYIIAMRSAKPWIFYFFSTGFASALLLNVLIPHLLVAIYTISYTPGLISAVLLNLPLSIWLLIKNRVHYSNRMQFIKHIFFFLTFGYLVFAFILGSVKLII